MLYIIGLGLGDDRDITLRGLEAVRSCSKVYMEAYTSLLSFGLSSNGLSNLVRTILFSLPFIFSISSFFSLILSCLPFCFNNQIGKIIW